MPVGQVLVWQRSAWMQPSENMKPRAVLTKSAPHAQRPRGARRGHELAGGDHADALLQARLDQRVDHARQRLLDRQAHVVDERLRRRAAAALAAVDHEEVRRVLEAAREHVLGEVVQEPASRRSPS